MTLGEWNAIRLSLQVAAAGVLLSVPAGIALGWILARKRFFGKSIVETLINLPLVLPPVVTGYLLLVTFGRRGLALAPHAYGRMIGHLLTTYTFAVQPETPRVTALATRLDDRLQLPGAVLQRARRYLDRALAVQREQIGLDVRVPLPW